MSDLKKSSVSVTGISSSLIVFEGGIYLGLGITPSLKHSLIPYELLETSPVFGSTFLKTTPSGTVNGINRTFYTSQEIYGYSPLLGAITLSGITIIAE